MVIPRMLSSKSCIGVMAGRLIVAAAVCTRGRRGFLELYKQSPRTKLAKRTFELVNYTYLNRLLDGIWYHGVVSYGVYSASWGFAVVISPSRARGCRVAGVLSALTITDAPQVQDLRAAR